MARRQVQIFINGKQVANQIKAITDEKRKLVRELARMDVGSKEYNDTISKIKQLNKPLNDHKNALKGVESSWERVTGGAKKFLSVSNIATVAGIAGITLGAEAAIDAVVDTVKEVNQLRREITQLTGAGGDQLDELTVKVRAIGLTFDQDTNEVLRAGNTLMKEFGLEADSAFDIIAEGNIKGANASGEFLENIREYSVQFAEAGFSAEEFLKISIRAQQEGIFSDKGLDFVKEFGLRIREQTPAVIDALDNAFGKGFTDRITSAINQGKITTADALKEISKELEATEIPANRLQTLLADVFGGPGEDAGLRAIQLLGSTQVELNNTSTDASIYEQELIRVYEANVDLAEAENKLATQLNSTGNSFSVLWTNIKTVGLRTLSDLLGIIEYAPIKIKASVAAIRQSFSNLFGGDEAKTATDAYYDTLFAELDKHEKKKQAVQEVYNQQEEERQKKIEEERAKREAARRDERSRKELEREAKELEKRQQRLNDIIKKFAEERTLDQLNEEDKKLEQLRLKYQEQIDIAAELEAEGVKGATAQRLELERLKEEAITALLHEQFEARQKQADDQLQEEIKNELTRKQEKEQALQEAQAEINAAIRETLLSERELALLELEAFYDRLILLAQQNGIDTLDIEITKRKELQKLNDEFDKEALDQLAENQEKRAEIIKQSLGELSGAIGNVISTLGNESRKFIGLQKALTLTQIAIDTAAAISSLTRNSEANPANAITFGAAGAVQFAAGLLRILSNIAKAKQILSEAPQRKHGGWATVRGADDGQYYRARLIGQPSTGLLDHPHPVLTSSGILANEVGREYYVSHSDLRNPAVLNHVRAIENITQHRQRQNGGFAPTDAAQNTAPGGAPADASATNNELKEVLSMNVQLLTRLIRDGVKLNLSDNELIAMSKHLDRLNKASGGRILN